MQRSRSKNIINEFGNEVIDNSANEYLKYKYHNFNRDLSGLPPEIREVVLEELLLKSALGVIGDSFRNSIK